MMLGKVSPVATYGRGREASLGMNGRASSWPSVPYPAPTSPYTMVASERRSPEGKGYPDGACDGTATDGDADEGLAVLQPLLDELARAVERIDVERDVRQLGRDVRLAADAEIPAQPIRRGQR